MGILDELAREGVEALPPPLRGKRVEVLTASICAWLLHALALWIWHAPVLFNAVLIHPGIHDLQHLIFLTTALLFWTALVQERRRDQQGAAILYLFTTTVHSGVLGALITFAERPWYSAYLQTSQHWGLTTLEDQQLGGLIMWVPSSLVYVGAALVLLGRWILMSDQGRPQQLEVIPDVQHQEHHIPV